MTTAVLRIAQGQRWPGAGIERSSTSPSAVTGPFPTKAWASLSPIERDRVIRGAKAEFAALSMAQLQARRRGRPGSHFHRRGFCCRRLLRILSI